MNTNNLFYLKIYIIDKHNDIGHSLQQFYKVRQSRCKYNSLRFDWNLKLTENLKHYFSQSIIFGGSD